MGQPTERSMPWPPSSWSGGVTPRRSLGMPIAGQELDGQVALGGVVKVGEDSELRFRTRDGSGADLGRFHGACLFRRQ